MLKESEKIETTVKAQLDAVPFGRTTKEEISAQYLKRAVMCTLRIRTAIDQLKSFQRDIPFGVGYERIDTIINGLSLALPEEK